jgi:glycosyltransferase involved in cell wall biosynthesis
MEQKTALTDFDKYKTDLPTIAVAIPAYRAARYISAVLRGIPEFVSFIVVVDDCSPDNTAEVVKQSDDIRVEVLRNEKI